ncbi:YigZ family protein [Holzapfeliella floricola]|uniref:YigZ family protein n=1 Tax=Holzapfeliella floricola DSM 23037 = JCM 16512 TaxID=1423744 RepID=A0A0R2DL38_9LACO|nr:YigZ family protein [Holzapfeliella floricola]KRN04179.1 hypothetical protein FC86_GL000276 [Holzapfeliella floricola DSM 23037 = JCM 16512]
MNYYTIKEEAASEIVIKKSRFIATFKRAFDEDEAKEFIDQIKKRHRSATHNCSAYIIGENNEHQRAHDDGEPSGTAGVPMLEALKMMNLQNVVVVVTRYFGGIKLGAGGLIRAYSNAVSKGAEEIGVVYRVLQPELLFRVDYANLGKIDYFLEQNEILLAKKEFGSDIFIGIFLDEADIEPTKEKIIQILSGKVEFEIGEARYNEIPA